MLTRDQNLQTLVVLHITVHRKCMSIANNICACCNQKPKMPTMALTSLLQFDLTDADNIGQNVTAKMLQNNITSITNPS